MSARIEIERQIDEQTKEFWSFNVFDLCAVFVSWHRETKPKGKKTWKKDMFWDNYSRRDFYASNEPELPQDIKDEVLKEVIKRISVKTWNEWKA